MIVCYYKCIVSFRSNNSTDEYENTIRIRANPGIGGHFRKLKISDFFQNYDDYKLHIRYQIEGPIIIFHLKGHKMKCVNYKIF